MIYVLTGHCLRDAEIEVDKLTNSPISVISSLCTVSMGHNRVSHVVMVIWSPLSSKGMNNS